MELVRHCRCHASNHWSDGCDQVRRLGRQAVRHERTVGDAGAEDPAAADLVDLADTIHDVSHELHIVDVLLLRPHPCDTTTVIPVAFHCLGIDDQKALFRSQVIEPGVPLHLPGVASTSVKCQNHRKRFVKPLRGKDEVLAAHSIDGDRVLNSFALEPLCHSHKPAQVQETRSGYSDDGCTTHVGDLHERAGSMSVDEMPHPFSQTNSVSIATSRECKSP